MSLIFRSELPILAAIQEYETEMRERGSEAVKASIESCKLVHLTGPEAITRNETLLYK